MAFATLVAPAQTRPNHYFEVAMCGLSLGLLALFVAGTAAPVKAPDYHVIKTIPIANDGGWDYVAVDDASRRVYVSHATRVEVLDADTGAIAGHIADTAGVHGIAVAADLGRGFTSNGRADTVTVFDLKTLKPLGTVPTGKNPDCIIYDPATHRVFAFNGRAASVTVIDAATSKVAATITLGGQPEFAAADGAGHVYVNLEDKNEVLRLDAKAMKVLDRWPLVGATAPCSMAIDAPNHRLFVGCRSKSLVVLNAKTGKAVAALPIGARRRRCVRPGDEADILFLRRRDDQRHSPGNAGPVLGRGNAQDAARIENDGSGSEDPQPVSARGGLQAPGRRPPRPARDGSGEFCGVDSGTVTRFQKREHFIVSRSAKW